MRVWSRAAATIIKEKSNRNSRGKKSKIIGRLR